LAYDRRGGADHHAELGEHLSEEPRVNTATRGFDIIVRLFVRLGLTLMASSLTSSRRHLGHELIGHSQTPSSCHLVARDPTKARQGQISY
jgi:hypothetical protein